MAGATAAQQMTADKDYPFSNSSATRLLQEGLSRAEQKHGYSQRTIAKLLNYKTSVVLSHMASGRVPIPIDRALDFARTLEMDAGEFLIAVLQQRHPEIDWPRHLAGMSKKAKTVSKDGSFVAEELESLAGAALDHLPQTTVNVLREVVSDRNASRRWMAMHEVPIIESLRSSHPNGLTPQQRKDLAAFVEKL